MPLIFKNNIFFLLHLIFLYLYRKVFSLSYFFLDVILMSVFPLFFALFKPLFLPTLSFLICRFFSAFYLFWFEETFSSNLARILFSKSAISPSKYFLSIFNTSCTNSSFFFSSSVFFSVFCLFVLIFHL